MDSSSSSNPQTAGSSSSEVLSSLDTAALLDAGADFDLEVGVARVARPLFWVACDLDETGAEGVRVAAEDDLTELLAGALHSISIYEFIYISK